MRDWRSILFKSSTFFLLPFTIIILHAHIQPTTSTTDSQTLTPSQTQTQPHLHSSHFITSSTISCTHTLFPSHLLHLHTLLLLSFFFFFLSPKLSLLIQTHLKLSCCIPSNSFFICFYSHPIAIPSLKPSTNLLAWCSVVLYPLQLYQSDSRLKTKIHKFNKPYPYPALCLFTFPTPNQIITPIETLLKKTLHISSPGIITLYSCGSLISKPHSASSTSIGCLNTHRDDLTLPNVDHPPLSGTIQNQSQLDLLHPITHTALHSLGSR